MTSPSWLLYTDEAGLAVWVSVSLVSFPEGPGKGGAEARSRSRVWEALEGLSSPRLAITCRLMSPHSSSGMAESNSTRCSLGMTMEAGSAEAVEAEAVAARAGGDEWALGEDLARLLAGARGAAEAAEAVGAETVAARAGGDEWVLGEDLAGLLAGA